MKTKRPYYQVKDVASQILDKFTVPEICHRVELAGSLRRMTPQVGDIEIIAVPRLALDLFGEPTGESSIDRLLEAWPIELIKNGQKFKQFNLVTKGEDIYQVDLFIQPDPATWGVNFMLRTGPRSFSTRMVTPKSHGGLMPSDLMVSGARVYRGEELLETPEEIDVFDLWGLGFIDPKDRR